MIENPRVQLLLILVVTIGALASVWFKELKLGPDLRGGTELIYEIDIDQAMKDGLFDQRPTETEINELMTETVNVIAERIDPTGVLEAVVVRRGQTGLLVELPAMDMTELDAVASRVSDLGKLEMRIVANRLYDKEDEDGNPVKFDLEAEKTKLNSWLDAEPGRRESLQEDPKRISQYNEDRSTESSKWLKWVPKKIGASLDNPDAFSLEGRRILDHEADVVKLYDAADLARKPETDEFLVAYYPVNYHERHFTGENLNAAGIGRGVGDNGRPAIRYKLKTAYADDYADWSEEYIEQQSAIILNGFVESAPQFVSRIPGEGRITGQFTEAQVAELVKILKTGSLKVKPIETSRRTIGANLGQQAVDLGLWSIVIGGLAVLVFILAYYRLAGLVAFVAIALNVFLIMGAIYFIEATLTLPGIAGLVLTMGMAVDANILIYERIREELKEGKDLLQAARLGFDRAMVTILDANITTFLAGLVLFNVGVGPIRGFAVTLMIGIVTSVFTAFFVSRLVFHYLIESQTLKEFKAAALFSNLKLNLLKYSKPAMLGSLIVVIAGLVSFSSVDSATKLGLDFTGGAKLQIVLREPIEAEALRDKIRGSEFEAKYKDWIVNTVGTGTGTNDGTRYNVKIKLTGEQRAKIEQDRRAAAAEDREYRAPYIDSLENVLGDMLVAKAFDGADLTPNPTNPGRQFAFLRLHFTQPVKQADLETAIATAYGNDPTDPNTVVNLDDPESDTGRNYTVEYNVDQNMTEDQLGQELSERLHGLLADVNGNEIELSDPIPESEEIGGRMVGELRNAAIGALVVSLFLIVMFIRVRFHEYKYGLAAVAALTHDVLITLGIVVAANAAGLVNAEIDLAMIAAFLTIIGYSINDTIVIFDRVRENLHETERLGEHPDHREIMNRSINQTLSRTILTTTTTLFVVLIQFVVNRGSGSALEGFSFALTIGLLAGTYSTIFIATPIVLWLRKREGAASGGGAAGQAA